MQVAPVVGQTNTVLKRIGERLARQMVTVPGQAAGNAAEKQVWPRALRDGGQPRGTQGNAGVELSDHVRQSVLILQVQTLIIVSLAKERFNRRALRQTAMSN